MPVVHPSEAVVHTAHGSTFSSYVTDVRPDAGPDALRAWRLDVPAGVRGVPHRPSRDEVLLVLRGTLVVTLDAERSDAVPGDVVVVPAGSRFTVDSGPTGASAWVTTTAGLTAELPDGSLLAPPWAQ